MVESGEWKAESEEAAAYVRARRSLSALHSLLARVDLPVLTQEMRIRQRGTKPFVVMFLYVAVLGTIAMVTVSATIAQSSYTGYPGQAPNLARQGRILFLVLSMAQLAMISLIVPAYSAGAVSTERERGTFDLLSLTLLSSSAIVMQKMAAAMAQALMLTLASLPVVSLVFMLGGVSPLEMAVSYALLLVTAGAQGALGLLCSCQFRNTRTSTFVAYLSVIGFMWGMPLLGELLRSLSRMQGLSAGFAPAFALMFAFVVGACALPPYMLASVLFRRYSEHWRSRTFRMLTFGVSFALTAIVLQSPSLTDPLIGGLYTHNSTFFLPTLVNPFIAIRALVGEAGYLTALQHWSIAGTLVFGIAAVFVFRQMSVLRFEAMRRT